MKSCDSADSANRDRPASHCVFAAPGRKRCDEKVLAGSTYCRTHQPLKGERKQCVHCKQMVLLHSLRHARVCSGNRPEEPYYQKGVNEFNYRGREERRGVSLDELEAKVVDLYNSYARPMLEKFPLETVAFSKDCYVSPSEKHRQQEEAICAFLAQMKMMTSETMPLRANGNRFYIDFGAGKGSLSKAVFERNKEFQNAMFICIEKASYKHKAERSRRTSSYRARIDLSDVNLSSLIDFSKRFLQPPGVDAERCTVDTRNFRNFGGETEGAATIDHGHVDDIVGMGKHLCGSATDLALMAIKQLQLHEETKVSSTTEKRPHKKIIRGICIALCCHSSSSWSCIAARPWLESHGIGETEFEIIRKWSGNFTVEENHETDEPRSTDDASIAEDLKITSSEKEKVQGDRSMASPSFNDKGARVALLCQRAALGKMCKRIIDFGRLQFVRNELGLEGQLRYYIDEAITPENVLLVAYPSLSIP